MPSEDPKVCQEIILLKAQLENAQEDLAELKTNVQELLHAWEQGMGVAKFVKAALWVSAPLIAFIIFIKDHVRLS